MFNQRGSLAQESPELFTAVVHVVENDVDLRDELDGLLTSVGLKHRMYEDLDELLNSEASIGRGCIVLDIPSSGMSQRDLAHLVRERAIKHPLIMMDAPEETSSCGSSPEFGAIEILPKPCSAQRLLETVSKALALIRRM